MTQWGYSCFLFAWESEKTIDFWNIGLDVHKEWWDWDCENQVYRYEIIDKYI